MDATVQFDARRDAYTTPLEEIDVSDPKLYQDDVWYP